MSRGAEESTARAAAVLAGLADVTSLVRSVNGEETTIGVAELRKLFEELGASRRMSFDELLAAYHARLSASRASHGAVRGQESTRPRGAKSPVGSGPPLGMREPDIRTRNIGSNRPRGGLPLPGGGFEDVLGGGRLGGIVGAVRGRTIVEIAKELRDSAAAPPSGNAPPRAESASTAADSASGAWINSEFERHPRHTPLIENETYILAFWIAPTESAATIAGLEYKLQKDDAPIALTIQLVSDDFTIAQPIQLLVVESKGVSLGRARFDVSPKRSGTLTLDAIVLKDGNLIQKVRMSVNAGAAGEAVSKVASLGRTTTPARAKRRDLTLEFERVADGFRVAAYGDARPTRGKLLMTDAALEALIGRPRAALQEMVNTVAGQRYVYQEAEPVPPDAAAAAEQAIARAGYRLFKDLFFSAGADDDVKAIGRKLIAAAGEPSPLRIQVTTNQVFLPWAILYPVDKFDAAAVDAERFLGMRHIVEQVPLVRLPAAFDEDIQHDRKLFVGLNVNRSIDADFRIDAVQKQLAYWEQLAQGGATSVIVRDTGQAVAAAMLDSNTPDHVTYCYCHAFAEGEEAMEFGDGVRMTLEQLNSDEPVEAVAYTAKPLFFINACNSATLSPLFYDGFVPYLLSKGARGVIGTECTVPAIFAARWATRFFSAFLNGAEVGDTVLALRRRFHAEDRNILGLAYALYCNMNTRIDPSLGITEGA